MRAGSVIAWCSGAASPVCGWATVPRRSDYTSCHATTLFPRLSFLQEPECGQLAVAVCVCLLLAVLPGLQPHQARGCKPFSVRVLATTAWRSAAADWDTNADIWVLRCSFGKQYDKNGDYIRHFLPVLKVRQTSSAPPSPPQAFSLCTSSTR